MVGNELIEAAQKWAADDLDDADSAQLRAWAAAKDMGALRAALSPPISFGTAGLRGRVGPGPAQMNPATIARVSFALGSFLVQEGNAKRGVVVGFDARPDSERFARLTAEVLSACGLPCFLVAQPIATPCVAYLLRKKRAAAGVVITASHNPRGDSGYKVFDGDGVQIVGPWDEEIASRTRVAPPARAIERNVELVEILSSEELEAYFKDTQATAEALVPLGEQAAVALGEQAAQPLLLPYTPLHGVGADGARRVLEGLDGYVKLLPVPEQAEPDGTFPTLGFPNPEEPGALDLLLSHATETGAQAAAAHDPDADRFVLCLPLGGGALAPLSGDALGLLFADACLRSTRLRNPEIISTIVSSPGISLLAELHGAKMTRTLTGFKWLCHAALESEAFLLAYEEAQGYCFSSPVGATTAMDKDGLLALVVATRLLLEKGGGPALADHLLSIYQDIGLWGSFGHSRRFDGPGAQERMTTQMDRLRESPDNLLSGLSVVRRVDYREHAEKRAWYLGPEDLVRFDLEADSPLPGEVTQGRVFVRPSGTEPKLKAYVHLRSDFGKKSEYAEKSAAQKALARAIARQVLQRPESTVPPSMRSAHVE